ncbi:uncharacterized protein [Penaeus vannamei]|uniref:uncharacterized protein n=1 Tax=Penaeus vannamei TaxID=6689 RepID=UPI00387F6346
MTRRLGSRCLAHCKGVTSQRKSAQNAHACHAQRPIPAHGRPHKAAGAVLAGRTLPPDAASTSGMTLLTRLVAWACLLTWASALLHYRIEDQAPAPIDTIQQLNARSRILCGIFCFRRRCQAFTFADGLCDLYNAGDDTGEANVRRYEVASELLQVANNKPSTASPNYGSDYKESANDNNFLTIYHSLNYLDAFWTVDLGGNFPVLSVIAFPNYFSSWHYAMFNYIEVSVGAEAPVAGVATGYTVLGHYIGLYDNSSCCSVEFTLGYSVWGRYVHIRRTAQDPNISDNFLVLKEVRIIL